MTPEGSVEIGRGPRDELCGVGCLGHGTDGGTQCCGVRHSLIANDGGGPGEACPCSVRLRGLGGGKVNCESQDSKAALGAVGQRCGGPCWTMDDKNGSVGRDQHTSPRVSEPRLSGQKGERTPS